MIGTISSNDRGQAFTLESIFASLLLLAAVLFALQTTAVTPLTGSTSNAQIQHQQSAVAEGVLVSANERGQLEDAVLFWDTQSDEWHGVDDPSGTYANPGEMGDAGLAFGDQLEESFLDWGVAANVKVHYYSHPSNIGDRRMETEEMVDMGSPSTNSVTAQRTIVLYEDDMVLDEDGEPEQTLSNSDFYAPNTAHDSEVYNIVTIEVEVWRI